MKRAISRALSVAVVGLVIVVAFLGYGLSYLSRPSPSTVTLTASGTPSTVTVISVETPSNCGLACSTTSPTTSVYQSASSTNGLRLDLSVAPSNGSVGTWVISVDEFNTLNSVNNVSIANNWLYPESYELNPYNPCGLLGTVGVGIFQGYYGMNNYTEARALALYNTSLVYMCVTTVSVPNAHYSIRPDSNIATVLYPGSIFSNTNTTLSLSFSANGYWTGGDGSQAPAMFDKFVPGIYTVLAADEWGKVVLVHIDVDPNGLIIGTSTSTASVPSQSSTDLVCVTTNYQVLGIESITVQNGTTTTLPFRTTTTSAVESTVTTTTNVTESVSYVTATTSYSPPSSWTVVECTYVK
ncbi:MAG: hypothetical protein JRN20_13965 [Nitrososphaerota archaeon]|nr:hypothetical protein [Nitrososphaerota archaeon]